MYERQKLEDQQITAGQKGSYKITDDGEQRQILKQMRRFFVDHVAAALSPERMVSSGDPSPQANTTFRSHRQVDGQPQKLQLPEGVREDCCPGRWKTGYLTKAYASFLAIRANLDYG